MMTRYRLVIGIGIMICMPLLLAADTFAAAGDEEAASLGYREAIILGIVEGITEFLPISSTGHLILTNELLGLNSLEPILDVDGNVILNAEGEPLTLKEAVDAYAIVIQAGAILAVLFLYWPRIWQVILGVLGLSPHGRLLARNLILAFIPAAVLGLLLEDIIDHYLFAPLPIAIALIAGGILMLLVESWRRRNFSRNDWSMDLHNLGIRQSLTIGLLQCVAMWPGTSRSMMTIVGGYLVGLSPAKAAEFSFLLGLITLTAASGYKAVTSGTEMFQAIEVGPILLGIFISFVAAALSIRWLIGYLTRHGLALFAYYRFLLAVLVILFVVL